MAYLRDHKVINELNDWLAKNGRTSFVSLKLTQRIYQEKWRMIIVGSL